mgnify:CR=1 FL=1
MELAWIILTLVLLVALAFFVKGRQLGHASKSIIQRFRDHGAIKEQKAKALEEMGLHSRPKYGLLMRDSQVEALSQLLRQGIICQAEQKGDTQEARFYFDEKKYPMA